jgi:hypothetical protein
MMKLLAEKTARAGWPGSTAMAALKLTTFYDNVWIFNIADVVIPEQTITNDGTRLLQVRFYPVATTELIRQPAS